MSICSLRGVDCERGMPSVFNSQRYSPSRSSFLWPSRRATQKDLARQANIRHESNVWTVSVGISAEIHIIKSDFRNIIHCADNYSKRKVLAEAEDLDVEGHSQIHFIHDLNFMQRLFALSCLLVLAVPLISS